ncbi:hypothetical protein Godav_006799 [Gossypium davidsonii]|uniref:Retrovirus-related Pol polyprotein from transposon TNT 1-94 n=1 Tax=Gossypium davidsonii TaxID=34287 RepID=A0A7J8S4Y5_GOSDV|nr:hypothetical protein [Gossypium davidsonii]
MEKTKFFLWKWLETLYATKPLVNRLNVKVQDDDESQAMLLLCSLPHSYKFFKETLIYDRDNLSFKDVKCHLLSEDKIKN